MSFPMQCRSCPATSDDTPVRVETEECLNCEQDAKDRDDLS